MDLTKVIDLIKYPIISDKASKLLESNQYTFAVDPKLSKDNIKNAIEYLFNVKVISVNTHRPPTKHRRIGKFVGTKTNYKKAILRLAPGDSINLFSETT
jgi:large subunit ribosomal protein L23